MNKILKTPNFTQRQNSPRLRDTDNIILPDTERKTMVYVESCYVLNRSQWL